MGGTDSVGIPIVGARGNPPQIKKEKTDRIKPQNI